MEEGLVMGAHVAHISWQVGKYSRDERSHRASFPEHGTLGRCLAHPGGITAEHI